MRIGSDNNWVCIEKVSPPHAASVYRFTAVANGGGCRFAATHEQVLLFVSNGIKQDFADFATLKVHQVELALSEGGWLLIKRHIKGFILVRYRVTCRIIGAALEGEIVLEAEAAKAFCNDFSALLCQR